jgi:anti-anti-sigma factor
MLTVDHHSDEGFDRLRLTGDLDVFGVSRLRQAAAVLRKELPLLVDLSAIHFIDGAGVSALVGVVRPNGHRSGNTVVVAGGPVTAALRQTGMDRVVALAETSEAAVAWLRSQPLSPAEYSQRESG